MANLSLYRNLLGVDGCVGIIEGSDHIMCKPGTRHDGAQPWDGRKDWISLWMSERFRSKKSSPPTSKIIPPVMAMRVLRSLSVPPQVVHFIPIHATPRPAMETMMPTIISARVACSEPGKNRWEWWTSAADYGDSRKKNVFMKVDACELIKDR